MMELFIIAAHNREFRFYRRMRIIIHELDAVRGKGVERIKFFDELYFWKRFRVPQELFLRLLLMILIYMEVAERMDKLACFAAEYLRNYHREERVAADIERHAEKDIGGALIELEA